MQQLNCFCHMFLKRSYRKKTGHRSLAGLRAYKNTSSDQLKGMAKMLDSATSFQTPAIQDENAHPGKVDVPERKAGTARL